MCGHWRRIAQPHMWLQARPHQFGFGLVEDHGARAMTRECGMAKHFLAGPLVPSGLSLGQPLPALLLAEQVSNDTGVAVSFFCCAICPALQRSVRTASLRPLKHVFVRAIVSACQ